MSPKSDATGRTLLFGMASALIALCVFQAVWALRTKEAVENVQGALAKLKGLEATLDRVEEKLDRMKADQDLSVDDISSLGKKLDALKRSLESRDRPADSDAPEPPLIDWTQPQLFEQAKRSAAEYGIELTADEVRVPSRFVLRQGAIEYFAVLKGGKEHETLISLLGNTPKGERRPKDFAARLNNAVQAIGFKRGKPVRFDGPGGATPPSGETAYLFVEWQEKGEKVLVRAEDLIWNRMKERPMEHGKWVYVGSEFAMAGDPPAQVFAADVTAEVVATYTQSPDTIFDDTSVGEFDDTTYLVASPRMPQDVDECTFVIRRIDRAPTKTFPDPPKDAGDESKPAGDDQPKPAGGDGERPR